MHKRAKYLDMPEYLPLAGAGDFQDFDGFVYVLSCAAAGAVKIGNANSPSTRATDLQAGNPFELKVVGLVAIAGINPAKVEFEAHRIGKREKRHIRGEWFVAEPIEAVEWIIKAAKTKRAR